MKRFKVSEEAFVNLPKPKSKNLCQFEDCTIRANYGYEGESPMFCSTHKQDEMINVISK